MSTCATPMKCASNPTPIEPKTLEQRQAYARRFLRTGRFYWTDAGFPKELDCSGNEYTKSPLRSFHTLPPSGTSSSDREPLRVSTNTTIWYTPIDGKLKRGKKQFNKRRPCYLASYDNSTNQGVIFLLTSTTPINSQRFVIVQSRSPKHQLQSGSLGTNPPWAFKAKSSKTNTPCPLEEENVRTYLNISHPLRVQLAYFPHKSFSYNDEEALSYRDFNPPLVSIAEFATQTPDKTDASVDKSITLDKESEELFWEKHKQYHMRRPGDDGGGGGAGPGDDGDGAGPGDGGGGGAGPSDGGGRAGPSDGGGRAGPSNDSGGTGPGNDGSSSSCVGPTTGGTRPSVGGGESSKGGFSSCKAENIPWDRVEDQRTGIDILPMTENTHSVSDEEMDLKESVINSDANDAPWGRVGNLRIGIDIPLVTEDIDSDSDEDEEMDSEEFVINPDTNDAPWGRVGNLRIGIDIPLVTEDIDSDSDEEMDLESVEEFQAVDDVANDVKPESSKDKGITIRTNSSDMDSSQSYTIPKPYFVIHTPLKNVCALLDYNHSIGEWRWTQHTPKQYDMVVSIEGLSYERFRYHSFLIGQRESTRRIFNWHTKEYIVLPPPPDECFNFDWMGTLVGMIVDTSVHPYAFKVIEGSDLGTIIYDSTENSWTHHPRSVPPMSVPPRLRIDHLAGNAQVASCKGVMFIIDILDLIVLYDTEKDKWDRVQDPEKHDGEKLCGLGSWGDRVFSSTVYMSQNAIAIEIRELVDMAKPEWKGFDAMPGEMCSWLFDGKEGNVHSFINVSHCSENLLIWARDNFSTGRFVLYNLARKTWDKLEPPLLASKDSELRRLLLD